MPCIVYVAPVKNTSDIQNKNRYTPPRKKCTVSMRRRCILLYEIYGCTCPQCRVNTGKGK